MDLSDREQSVLEQIEMLIRQGRSEGEAASTLGLITGEDELVARMVAYRHAIAEERRTFARRSALYDAEDVPAPWYTGPRAQDIFWPGLRSVLEADTSWRD